MRIVHDVRGLVQTGGGGVHPYCGKVGDTTLPVDGYVDEIVIVCHDNQNEKEVLYVQGTLASMWELAEQLRSILLATAEFEVAHGRLDPEWRTKGPERLHALYEKNADRISAGKGPQS